MLRVMVCLTLAFPLAAAELPRETIETRCVSCHDASTKAGRLDLSSLKYNPADPQNFAAWVRVYDRVAAGEMPPKRKLDEAEKAAFTKALQADLLASEAKRVREEGRATWRRLNRFEYEAAVRDLFGAHWLQLRDILPEDATAFGFNKCGDALEMSHVQMSRYLTAADVALRQMLAPERPNTAKRYYARDCGTFTRRMFYSAFNNAPERATFPTLGFAGQPLVRQQKAPMTDPKNKELEGVGLVCGAYEPVEPKFDDFKAPAAGKYRLKLMAHTAWVGPNGTAGKAQKWSIPDLDHVSKGRRSEPVTLYAEMPPRQLRRLGSLDVEIEPTLKEIEVWLQAGETIRPDASRLFRSRPGNQRFQNPLAEKDGQPAVVYRWLDVEGPLPDAALQAGRTLITGGLPVKVDGKRVELITSDPKADAKRLLAAFAKRAWRRPISNTEALRFLPVVENKMKAGGSFTEAMIAGYTAVLCSPEFLTLRESPGKLSDHALAARLSFFLWNSAPDAELRQLADRGELSKPGVLAKQVDRLIDDPRSRRFNDAFLDYWLDLRKMSGNAPDAALYGDYYLDDWLLESAEEETQLYFREMLKANLPAKAIVHSDFAMVNERLAVHYGLPSVKGTAIRKVPLPKDSLRGGLITQTSVLMVTANGTTTSPVLRGAWMLERIIGLPTAPPPPVPAVEPDLRGLTTIREQLAKHRDQASCAACHAKIDPPGFALECFDVMGGYRSKYRALTEKGREPGLGKNGQPFEFKYGLPVDNAGTMPDGKPFKDLNEFKSLLLRDERQLARNLARQLTAYATGAPVGFADRDDIEKMLDETKASGYGARQLVHALVQSELFRNK